MKKILAVILLVLSCNCVIFAENVLSRGTFIQARIVDAIKSNQQNISTTIIVDNDVNIDGKVLIKRGTPIVAQIERKKARGCGRPGTLNVKFLTTEAVDGQTIILSGGTMSIEGDAKKGLAIGLGVGLGWFFWPGLGCLAIRGGQAEIPADTLINNIMVGNNYKINL